MVGYICSWLMGCKVHRWSIKLQAQLNPGVQFLTLLLDSAFLVVALFPQAIIFLLIAGWMTKPLNYNFSRVLTKLGFTLIIPGWVM